MDGFETFVYVAVVNVVCNKLSHAGLVMLVRQEFKSFFYSGVIGSEGIICVPYDFAFQRYDVRDPDEVIVHEEGFCRSHNPTMMLCDLVVPSFIS